MEPRGAMQGFVEVRELVVPRRALSIRVEKSNRKLNSYIHTICAADEPRF